MDSLESLLAPVMRMLTAKNRLLTQIPIFPLLENRALHLSGLTSLINHQLLPLRTNPQAMATITKNTVFTNVAETSDGGVYWEGLEDEVHFNCLIIPSFNVFGPGLDLSSIFYYPTFYYVPYNVFQFYFNNAIRFYKICLPR